MTIKDMIEKRAKVWETAKNFVDTHENENGVLSAEDNATYSRMDCGDRPSAESRGKGG